MKTRVGQNVFAQYVAQVMSGFIAIRTQQVFVQVVNAQTMAAIAHERNTMACSQFPKSNCWEA